MRISIAIGICILFGTAYTSASGDCNGVGNLPEGSDVCNCTNPYPGVGESGWTGKNCEMKVFGGSLDGEDMALSCQNDGCNILTGSLMKCFAIPLLWRDSNQHWNHLVFQMNRTSQNGDPDMYGTFYGGSKGQGKIPSGLQGAHDFLDISNGAHKTVIKSIRKYDFGSSMDYTGIYVCLVAYDGQTTEFQLRGRATQCPSGFLNNGTSTICSTSINSSLRSRYSTCTSGGECVCVGEYSRPEGSTVKGVGFEDCSAHVTNIRDAEFAHGHFSKTHISIKSGLWQFFSFNIVPNDFHIVVQSELESQDKGTVQLFARMGEPPGKAYDQFDLKSTYQFAQDQNPSLEIKKGDAEYRAGLWYVGVYSDRIGRFNYSISISKYECLSGCNGNGRCLTHASGPNKCQCYRGYFKEDCSESGKKLEFNKQILSREKKFEYQYFQIPKISALSRGNNVEISLEAKYKSGTFPQYFTSTPRLLLLKGQLEDYPTIENYTYMVELLKNDSEYSMALCPSILDEEFSWKAAIYNPIPNFKIGYQIRLRRIVSCLNNCSGNGSCDEYGICQCKVNYAGGDCSVDLSKLVCTDGSRLPDIRAIEHGTCWRSCVCRPGRGCRFQEKCTEISCHDGWRFSSQANKCVQDECKEPILYVGEDYVCMKPCLPSSGEPAKLSAECQPDSFHCIRGSKTLDEHGNPHCLSGCEENSLVPAQVKTKHGRAFLPCLCSTSDSFNRICKHKIEGGPVVLHCHDGFMLTGGKKIIGSDFMAGGQCVKLQHSDRTMPAWGIAIFGFFALVVGAAIVLILRRKSTGPTISQRLQNMYFEKMHPTTSDNNNNI